jgi:hypothetical protein
LGQRNRIGTDGPEIPRQSQFEQSNLNPNFGNSTSQFHFSRSQNNPLSRSTYRRRRRRNNQPILPTQEHATFNFTHNPIDIDHQEPLDESYIPQETEQNAEDFSLQQALINSLIDF